MQKNDSLYPVDRALLERACQVGFAMFEESEIRQLPEDMRVSCATLEQLTIMAQYASLSERLATAIREHSELLKEHGIWLDMAYLKTSDPTFAKYCEDAKKIDPALADRYDNLASSIRKVMSDALERCQVVGSTAPSTATFN